MELKLQTTEDGSHTLYWEEKNEHYHSTHGSVQESLIVYIQAALLPRLERAREKGESVLRLFEMGFGTGLNALLSMVFLEKWIGQTGYRIDLEYTSIEANPLPEEWWMKLNHPFKVKESLPDVKPDLEADFQAMHRQDYLSLDSPWKVHAEGFGQYFSLRKINGSLLECPFPSHVFDVVYYDAFAPSVQPELWEPDVFSRIILAQRPGGVLSTYCAQGRFKRVLKEVGYKVENLPGPAGKREITRAWVL